MNNSYQYTGNPIEPKFVLNFGDKILENGIDYTINFINNINAGIAKAEIIGKGKFTGIVSRTFEILPVPAKSLSFYADTTIIEYSGQPVMLNLSVQFGDVLLSEGKDYVIDYENNINVGKALAKISFMGNYTGTMNVPFIIKGFANTSELSESEILFGNSVEIKSSVQGGKPPYKYAYFCRKTDSDNWHRLSGFTENNIFNFKPDKIKDYVISVKIMDSEGQVSKKYLNLSVISKLECNCVLSNDTIQLSESVRLSVDMLNGTAPFKYSYLMKNDEDTKWITLKKGSDISNVVLKPLKSGEYTICVKISDSEQYMTKQYLKLTVTE